jgi:hypothetical protein
MEKNLWKFMKQIANYNYKDGKLTFFLNGNKPLSIKIRSLRLNLNKNITEIKKHSSLIKLIKNLRSNLKT